MRGNQTVQEKQVKPESPANFIKSKINLLNYDKFILLFDV